jgi:hypothetical protein
MHPAKMFTSLRLICVALILGSASRALSAQVPPDIERQLPSGYSVLGAAQTSFGSELSFYFVGLGSRQETGPFGKTAPPRPLLIYALTSSGHYDLIARNDQVILPANAGGQCDPFEGRIATKGRFFTVENGVGCGAHWTDYVTFRFSDRLREFVFDNWRVQSWSFNPSNAPDAQALIPDGQKVVRAGRRIVRFSEWRRP